MTLESNPPVNRLDGLQMLRGIAAVAVMLYHSSHYVLSRMPAAQTFDSWVRFFDYRFSWGVQLFFVLSGFVMWRLVTAGTPAKKFMVDRLVRIYPPFLLCVGLTLGAKLFFFGSVGFPLSHVLAMTLLPLGPREYPLGVEWSLVYEMSFYALMTFVILLPSRLRLPALGVWIVAIFLTAKLFPAWASVLLPGFRQVLLSSFCLPFIFGCIVAHIYTRHNSGPAVIALLTGITFLILGGYVPRTENKQALLGLGFAAITLATLWFNVSSSTMAGRALARLGDWSYGIYLAHVPVITIFLALTPPTGAGKDFIAASTLALCLAGLFGAFENQMHAKLKRLPLVQALARPRKL